jgi:hypothetical protein
MHSVRYDSERHTIQTIVSHRVNRQCHQYPEQFHELLVTNCLNHFMSVNRDLPPYGSVPHRARWTQAAMEQIHLLVTAQH